MANEPERIKPFNLFIGGKKVGTLVSSNYTIAGNDEEQISAEGWSMSDGQTTSSISASTIVPIDGKTAVLEDALLNKRYIKVQVGIVNGKIHAITMRATEAKYDTDHKSGTLKGDFTLKGGKPTRT